MLRNVALIFASNIAMDPSHRGKRALLDADILTNIVDFLKSPDTQLKSAVLSLVALLAVPKEGKNDIATDDQMPTIITDIIKNDKDEACRKAAESVRTLVCELPLGKAIMGGEGA